MCYFWQNTSIIVIIFIGYCVEVDMIVVQSLKHTVTDENEMMKNCINFCLKVSRGAGGMCLA